ncbi:MAG: M20/M25/M40 family metallo-hydrolase [Oscillospiraceae bacterium]|nr:M20/M25/M40 family metallo-hydrolase [Oscillospiraceae bacterium]
MKDRAFRVIETLCSICGVSGREQNIGMKSAELLRAYIPNAAYHNGLVTASLGSDAEKPNLLFCAHMDQVGFLVTDITEEGFLRIGAVGGIDHRLLLGQPVTVEGKQGALHGVLSILPPHLLKREQAVPEDAQLCVDLGYDSGAEVEQLVSRGDAVYYGTSPRKLQNGLVTAPALDNRCGVAALIRAAELLADADNLPCNVMFVCSGQEERSGRGARQAAYQCRPDYAVAVDTTFGMAHGESPEECFPLGKGPAIGISSMLSAELSDAMTETAKAAGIDFQVEVMPEGTGTDADALALAPGGCAAGTLSIPIRNMHTPVEVVQLSDVEQTAQLMAAYARRCGRA